MAGQRVECPELSNPTLSAIRLAQRARSWLAKESNVLSLSKGNHLRKAQPVALAKGYNHIPKNNTNKIKT
jgi:hypothetical protein